MNSRSWNTITLATIFTVAVANCALAYMLDPYGLWRDPAGRKLSVAVITNGRKAKFLMSKRYIPANFGGLIIGPSSIANWDVSNLGGAQIYNLAIDGADSAEERLVLDQALLRGRYKIAVFALVPIITANHEVKGGLDSTTTAESVASFHLYIQEVAYALRAAHRETDYVDIAPNGHYNYHKQKNLEHWDLNPDLFTIDPIALKHYREMILKLQSQGATIVYVVPPIYEGFYQLHRADYETYNTTVRALLPKAPVIDFSSSEYAALRNDPSNFVDVMHLEPQGAQTFSALLSTFVSQTLQQGQ